MLIKRGSDITTGEITDRALYLNRRAFMMGAAALALVGSLVTVARLRTVSVLRET